MKPGDHTHLVQQMTENEWKQSIEQPNIISKLVCGTIENHEKNVKLDPDDGLPVPPPPPPGPPLFRMMVQNGGTQFPCVMCGMVFDTVDELEEHCLRSITHKKNVMKMAEQYKRTGQ